MTTPTHRRVSSHGVRLLANCMTSLLRSLIRLFFAPAFEALQEFVRKPPGGRHGFTIGLRRHSPRENHYAVSWVVSSTPRSPVPASLQLELSLVDLFESALPFGFNPGDAVTDRNLIGRGVCSLGRYVLDRL